ncbi:hypothetical protein LCGC14_2041900 [marine sediment metagenome]|uniref:Uncharacterized protein n=1 Tax=marine sediment metagenome TaxID=412755 RepID=A0A0F9HNL1_9ZZZZ
MPENDTGARRVKDPGKDIVIRDGKAYHEISEEVSIADIQARIDQHIANIENADKQTVEINKQLQEVQDFRANQVTRRNDFIAKKTELMAAQP